MCYAKPGPRCSSHAGTRYETTSKKLTAVLEEVQPELDRINEERQGQEGAKRATEADLPVKLQKKLKVARGRHRDATRQFDATPAGVKHLDQRVKESALRTKQANDACSSWIDYKYPGETEDTVKEQLKSDQDWTVLKQERTSSRSELTRMSNRRKYAEDYRANDLAEYKTEQKRQSYFAAMKSAAENNDREAFLSAMKESNDNMRPMNNVSELQRRREPTITSPVLDKNEIQDADSKRVVAANHSVNLSQGGTMVVDTKCFAQKAHDGYIIQAKVDTEIRPENEQEKDFTKRKGFGMISNGNERHQTAYLAPTRKVFGTLKEAEAYMRDNKKELSYKAASLGIHRETTRHDNLAIVAMSKKIKKEEKIPSVA